MASGETFDQMLERVQNKRATTSASSAAEGAMPSFTKKDDSDKGMAPTRATAPAFAKKGSFGRKGKPGKKGFAPASRGMRFGGGR